MNLPIDIHTHIPFPFQGQAILQHSSWQSHYPDGWFSVGIHPMTREEHTTECLEFIRQTMRCPRCLMLGECGLDARSEISIGLQKHYLERQIEISEEAGKPLLLHVVRMVDEILAMRKVIRPLQPWILHGFRGKPQQAEQLLRLGFRISLGAHFNEETASMVDLDHLLVETDESHLGIMEVIRDISEARGMSTYDLHEALMANVRKLFQKE